MDHISGLSQKCPDFFEIMSGILDPRIPTFWNLIRAQDIFYTLNNFNVFNFTEKYVKSSLPLTAVKRYLDKYTNNSTHPPEKKVTPKMLLL